MALDAGIFNQLAVRPKSMIDYTNELNQQDQNALALKTGQVNYQNALQDQTDAQAMRTAAKGFGMDPQANYNALLQTGNVKGAQNYLAGVLANQKTQADTGLATSHAKNFDAEAVNKHLDALGTISKSVLANPTPQAAQAALAQWESLTGTQDPAERATVAGLQTPEQVTAWARSHAMRAEDLKTRFETRNTGGSTQTLAIDPLTNKVTVASEVANTVSPDTTENNATHIKVASITQAGETARAAANRQKDYTIAGMNPDGTPLAAPDGKVEPWIANAAARFNLTGELPTGIGRGTQGAADMRRIQREAASQSAASGLTPDQRAQQQVTGKRTLASFAPGGKDGQAVEAADIGLNHIDTLRQLATAQGNGDMQLFNKIANEWAKQTGNPAPTNLQGAITMVGPEITKSVVGVGGGVGDREKVDKALKAVADGGPAQAGGQLATIEDLLGGRLMEKKRSYERGTGLHDFESGGFLSPAAQKVLSKRLGTGANGGAAPAASGLSVSTPDGQVHTFPNAAAAAAFKKAAGL